MKKLIALFLALIMVLSLVACGNQANTEESSTSNEQTEATTSDSEETGSTEENTEPEKETEASTKPEEETEASTKPEEETPAFDTSWAGDKYIMPIPAPPVSDFKIDEIIGSSGGNAVQVAAQDVQNLTNDEVVAYRQTLESLGFVNDIYESDFDSRQGYEFSAKNVNGDIVYINYNHSAGYFILIFEFAK